MNTELTNESIPNTILLRCIKSIILSALSEEDISRYLSTNMDIVRSINQYPEDKDSPSFYVVITNEELKSYLNRDKS